MKIAMTYSHLLHRAILRQDLASFIAKCVTTISPGVRYLENWHIDLIADYLTAASKGDITRLLINMPPRYLKSVCVSVAWPAWMLGRTPSTRIMAASYSQILSLKHSMDCRLVMNSPWYQEIFPETSLSPIQNEKNKFMTTQQGFRFATSVGGTATGEGGDFLIVDDPHNPLQAASLTQRQHTIEWFDQTFTTRLNDKKKGVIVVVMQRLHPYDLSGHLLEKAGNRWEHICIPAIAESPVTHYYFNSTTALHHRPSGDVLHTERENQQDLHHTKEELGNLAFSSQYQQSPVITEGGMLELSWLKRHHLLDVSVIPSPAKGERIIQSWDTAIKTGKTNDYSVCTTWLERQDGYYLLDVWCKRAEYPELKRTIIHLATHWSPEVVLLEDKASGQSLLQDLRQETTIALIPIMPKQDKVSRFAATTPLFEAGKVLLPATSPWLADYELQLLHFPDGSHDDMVDSTSQALQWMHNKKSRNPRIRQL
jgi:predicted phage terminase large subunit-like protein